MKKERNQLTANVLFGCACSCALSAVLCAPAALAQTAGPAPVPPAATEAMAPVADAKKIDQPLISEKTAVPSASVSFRSIYNTPRVDEKAAIYQAWQDVFHTNVWAPYDMAKEIEDKVCEKASVKVFKLKGKPQHSDEGFLYIFKARF